MKIKLSGFLLSLVLLYSCHPVRMVVKHVDHKYERWHTVIDTVVTEKAKIQVRTLGEGSETLLMIHGYGPMPQAQWLKQAKFFKEGYRIIIPDLVYFGGSHSKEEEYSVDFQAEQVNAVLDHFGVEKAYVMGLSYGGMVAARMASLHPDRVQKLVLVDALSRYYEREHVDSLVRANEIEYIGDLLLPDNTENLRKLYQFTFKKRKIPAFMAKEILENLYQDQREEKLKVLRYIDESSDYLGSIDYRVDFPVLIVWGAEDMLIPVRNAISLHNYYPNSTIQFIARSGHTPNFEQSKEFNTIVGEFLNE